MLLQEVWFLGYTKDENKRLVIVPEEAEVVKRIYREYLEGASLLGIGQGLEADGILTGAKKPKWRSECIKKILQNEKYIGDALLQKTYTVDFLTKKRVKNNGHVPQYYLEGCHEAIIPREIYMQVQEELLRRSNLKTGKADGSKRIYSSKYALSSIAFCGECGDIYRRIHWNNRGKKAIVWRCVSRLENNGECHSSRTIHEEDLHNSVLKAMNQLISDSKGFMDILEQNIATVLGFDSDKDTAEIENQLVELQEQIVKTANRKEDYTALVDEIYRLREERQAMQEYNADRQGKRQRIADMRNFLEERTCQITEYDDRLVRKLVKRVEILSDKIIVGFKSGISVKMIGN